MRVRAPISHAVLEDRLAGRIWIRQDIGIDVDDDLVSLSGCAGIDAAVERGFRDESERVCLLLGRARRLFRNVLPSVIERLASGCQRLHDHRPDLRRQSPS